VVSAIWGPGRNWKVQAEGGKDASESSLRLQSKGLGGIEKRDQLGNFVKDKDENLTSTNIMDPGVIRNEEGTRGRHR
jgi:hypothetical protein